jgi:hypothetical protein
LRDLVKPFRLALCEDLLQRSLDLVVDLDISL